MNEPLPHDPTMIPPPADQDVQWLRERLFAVAEAEPAADLTRRVMIAVKHEQARESTTRRWWRAAAAAAVVGLSAWGLSVMNPRGDAALVTTPALTTPEMPGSGVREALDWFCRTQERDGSWDPARWGGDPRFEVALTALPLWAIHSAGGERSPAHLEAAAKAQSFLLSHCDERGRFGPAFYGSSYTQGIATLALLSSYQQQPDATLKRAIQRALDVIVSRQLSSGAWPVAEAAQPDVTVTLWQREALKLAAELGWDEVRPHLSLAGKWLDSHARSTPDPRGLVPGEDLDFFSLYVATTTLRESGDDHSLDQLTSIQKSLREKQIQQGEDSGSWTPDDRWARVGGRLYSTAMASLALK